MKTARKFRHLTQSDRDRIHALYGSGHRQKDIAEVLGVDPGTICRELSRYGKTTWRYSATRAQNDAVEKRKHSKCPGMKIEANFVLKRFIITELKNLRSPDEIAGRLKRLAIVPRTGTNAIYKWLYSEAGKPYCRYLCTKRTKKRRQHRLLKKVLIPDRMPLNKRPKRRGLIHAERDLFVSPTNLHSKPVGLLIVVRYAKLFVGSIVPSKGSTVVSAATRKHFKRVHVDTCTADNGIENIHHAATGVPTYFCDKGAPWQKPSVEGGIGLVRRWFLPKGTDLATIPDEVFQSLLHLLNRKYRKSLGYRSAYEVALERGIIKRIPKKSLSKAIAFR